MSLEIHKPELVQRVHAQIQSRHLHDADELLEQALDALGRGWLGGAARMPGRKLENVTSPLG